MTTKHKYAINKDMVFYSLFRKAPFELWLGGGKTEHECLVNGWGVREENDKLVVASRAVQGLKEYERTFPKQKIDYKILLVDSQEENIENLCDYINDTIKIVDVSNMNSTKDIDKLIESVWKLIGRKKKEKKK